MGGFRGLAVAAIAAALGLSLLAAPAPAAAQSYPSQPVRLVVPYPPGGGTDLLGRILAEAMTARLGQAMVVENKAGAAGTIGSDYVAKSKADGYTLLWATSDAISLAPALRANLPYQVPGELSFIASVTSGAYIILINPKLPINTLADLIAYAKANPGKVRYGSTGVGSGPHMTAELFAKTAGIQLTHIPYTGNGPVVSAVMGGVIEMMLGGPSLKSQIEAGNFRAIAVTSEKRLGDFPNLPTLKEAGLDLSVVYWQGLLGPASLPEAVQTRLRDAVADLVKDPGVLERIKKTGLELSYLPGDAFKSLALKELDQWKDVAKTANIKLE